MSAPGADENIAQVEEAVAVATRKGFPATSGGNIAIEALSGQIPPIIEILGGV